MISIILPIRNEGAFISNCIDAVLSQDYPIEQMEILIIDGMSTDETRDIIQSFQIRYPQIRIIENPGRIVPTGLNTGIISSKGDTLIRIDGHTVIARDYVRLCVETLHRTNADNVGGCMTAEGTTKFGKAVALATSTPFGIGNSKFHYATTEQLVDSVYLGAWPKEVFSKIGLFDEELVRNQDDEFNYRLRKFNGKIILNPKIRSVYTVRSKPNTLFKQYFQYGLWKIRVLQKHPRQMSLRQFIPPLFVSSLLLSSIASLFTPWGKWFLFTIFASYLLTNIAFSFVTAKKKGWKHLEFLPYAFAIIHISYGTGFLVGLIKFWNRWRDKKGKVPEF